MIVNFLVFHAMLFKQHMAQVFIYLPGGQHEI